MNNNSAAKRILVVTIFSLILIVLIASLHSDLVSAAEDCPDPIQNIATMEWYCPISSCGANYAGTCTLRYTDSGAPECYCKIEEPCIDECTEGLINCLPGGTEQFCRRDYDEDNCLELGGDVVCSKNCKDFYLPEICTDGVDNDCDLLVDCLDPNCASYPDCIEPCIPEWEAGEWSEWSACINNEQFRTRPLIDIKCNEPTKIEKETYGCTIEQFVFGVNPPPDQEPIEIIYIVEELTQQPLAGAPAESPIEPKFDYSVFDYGSFDADSVDLGGGMVLLASDIGLSNMFGLLRSKPGGGLKPKPVPLVCANIVPNAPGDCNPGACEQDADDCFYFHIKSKQPGNWVTPPYCECDVDTDGDGIPDTVDGNNPFDGNGDGDFEDPRDDWDGDGEINIRDDSDGDGLVDAVEFLDPLGILDPLNPDSDGDTIWDGWHDDNFNGRWDNNEEWGEVGDLRNLIWPSPQPNVFLPAGGYHSDPRTKCTQVETGPPGQGGNRGSDGLTDYEEVTGDMDGDGLRDQDREFGFDTDGDGTPDAYTSPILLDTEDDGVIDGWSDVNKNCILDAPDNVGMMGEVGDPDRAFAGGLGTNPNLADTDGDGITDFVESRNPRLDPLNPDSDGDGLWDGWHDDVGAGARNGICNLGEEWGEAGDPRVAPPLCSYRVAWMGQSTDPTLIDTDGDTLTDYWEIFGDFDEDGVLDEGLRYGFDADNDGISEWYLNPLMADTDGDGQNDGVDLFPQDLQDWQDTDGDGVGDNTDDFPNDPAASVDTDGDGYPDAWNPGKGKEDSTSDPQLELDAFPNDINEWADFDNDGLGDNLQDDDDDNDGYLDVWEGVMATDPLDDDSKPINTDNDGPPPVPDGDPRNTWPWMDTDDDNDGFEDSWEDLDQDGIFEPLQGESNPKVPGSTPIDTDGDGDPDGDLGNTQPWMDTDDDGDSHNDNVDDFPLNAEEWLDTDGDGIGNNADEDDDWDGIPDEWENLHGLNPLNKQDGAQDPDNDGLTNIQEFQEGTDPNDADTDDDGQPDGWEVDNHLDPTVKDAIDTDEDGDPDGDLGNTQPWMDTDDDNDKLPDDKEILIGSDPLVKDTDNDGLEDGQEDANRNGNVDPGESDPTNPDTDDDGVNDGAEVANGRNPVLACGDIVPQKKADCEAESPCGAEQKTCFFIRGVELNPPGGQIPQPQPGAAGQAVPGQPGPGQPGEVKKCVCDVDADGNGLPDTIEGAWMVDIDDDGWYVGPNDDWDGDGIPNKDDDSDIDGLSDYAEITGDTNGDGVIEWNPGYDSDGDQVNDMFTNPNAADTDNDGLKDDDEIARGLDPNNNDADNDGLLDGDEIIAGTDPLLFDTDTDGLSDGDEVLIHGTDPLDTDSDDDGLTDYQEVTGDMDGDGAPDHPFGYDSDKDGIDDMFTNPNAADTDGDGFTDKEEVDTILLGADPNNDQLYPPDFDRDGILDAQDEDDDNDGLLDIEEDPGQDGQDPGETNPLDPDSDDDGILDGKEVNVHHTDPLNPDSDGDGLWDGWQDLGTDGLPNTNDVGETNGQYDIGELTGELGDSAQDGAGGHGTDPKLIDSDTDGLNDGDEVNVYETDPAKADTDGDGLWDGWHDDGDGAWELGEEYGEIGDPNQKDDNNKNKGGYWTDPLLSDSDKDGLSDKEELNLKPKATNPLLADSDGDEKLDGADAFPREPDYWQDSDCDGVPDEVETKIGSNPKDAKEIPCGLYCSYGDCETKGKCPEGQVCKKTVGGEKLSNVLSGVTWHCPNAPTGEGDGVDAVGAVILTGFAVDGDDKDLVYGPCQCVAAPTPPPKQKDPKKPGDPPAKAVCGNGKCESGETATSCARDCKTTQPPIQTSNSVSKTWEVINPSEPIRLESADLGFGILISVAKSLSNVHIEMTSLSSKPGSVPAAPGEVYKYFSIDATNIGAADISSAIMAFTVDKGWIASRNADIQDVVLMRYTEGWDALATKVQQETSSAAYYSASTPGLSYFAIVIPEGGVSKPSGGISMLWIAIIIGGIIVLTAGGYIFYNYYYKKRNYDM